MSKESGPSDPFEETRREIEEIVQQTIKEYLMPLQTKKLSKKMIEQIASDCASKIAGNAVIASRKASNRHAAQVTGIFSEILQNQELLAKPVFNDKLAAFVGKLSPEDVEKIKNDHEIAARVVSRVYKSIFDFALEIGLKSFEEKSQPPAPDKALPED